MMTFTLPAFLLILFTTLVAGLITGFWIILTRVKGG